jgi:hypothetical protein
MRAIIGCDSFLSLRNVHNGNLGQYLNGLHVLVDPNQIAGSRIACPETQIDPLIDFDVNSEPTMASLFLKSYLARKAYYDAGTLWTEMRGSIGRNYPNRTWRRFASTAKSGIRFTTGWVNGALGRAQGGRRACARALRSHPLAEHYRRLFEDIAPDLVAGFSPEGLREMLLMEAANDVGLPTAVMIRSRDNLAAKIQHLPDADRYFVWADATRDFLLSMYPEIDPAKVEVTGSPQFDHHLDPSYSLKREEFFELVGLDPGRPLIVYTMMTPGLYGHEAEIAQHLADAAHDGRFVGGAQLLVRGHPRMFGSDVKLLHREYQEARAYPSSRAVPYRSKDHEAEVVRLIIEDEPVHLSTLAYQDVQVNVCGTMTIDSAIFDKPVVNIYYDVARGIESGASVRRFYARSDVKQMMGYGASRLARDPEHCIRLINRYLEEPGLDADGRRRAREEDCGPLDGKSGWRIAKSLGRLAVGNVGQRCVGVPVFSA